MSGKSAYNVTLTSVIGSKNVKSGHKILPSAKGGVSWRQQYQYKPSGRGEIKADRLEQTLPLAAQKPRPGSNEQNSIKSSARRSQ